MPETIDCTADALVAASKCFDCLTKKQQDMIMIYLLAVLAGETLDPAALMEKAKCFCIPPGFVDAVKIYLLCQIVTAEEA